jgi:hypothetical protein
MDNSVPKDYAETMGALFFKMTYSYCMGSMSYYIHVGGAKEQFIEDLLDCLDWAKRQLETSARYSEVSAAARKELLELAPPPGKPAETIWPALKLMLQGQCLSVPPQLAAALVPASLSAVREHVAAHKFEDMKVMAAKELKDG